MRYRNKIISRCKTCVSVMLLQSYLNKWRLSQFSKLDKLFINSASTRLLQISKISLIEYNNQIFPNTSHLHLKACDTASSCSCLYLIMGSNIKKMGLYFELLL